MMSGNERQFGTRFLKFGFRPWGHRHITTAIISFLAILLSTFAWLCLVFSSSATSWNYNDHVPFPWNHSHPINENAALNPNWSLLRPASAELSLSHIVFGIAGSAQLWNRRSYFVRLWWRPGQMRGHIWLEELPVDYWPDPSLPPLHISEDISRFRYTNPLGHPSGLRIARIISECIRLNLPDVRWFVLGDDDTIFSPDNLVTVLKKYDSSEMLYIGSPSESHSANTYFSHTMAFGGGGIAISYPLANAISQIQDDCLERYPKLYGSDDRLHACISEIGVPLTREYGFHQWDIRGSVHGLLSAHPIAPFVSIHHLEAVDPIYPGLSLLDGLQLFARAMKTDPMSFLQRAVCYDHVNGLTFSVSLGYTIQVYSTIISPRDLERSEKTYSAWNKVNHRYEFDFDTRDVPRWVCKRPILFFLKDIWKKGNITIGLYDRNKSRESLKRRVFCFPQSIPLRNVKTIQVLQTSLSKNWYLAPRRLCCKVSQARDELLQVMVRQCGKGTYGSAIGLV